MNTRKKKEIFLNEKHYQIISLLKTKTLNINEIACLMGLHWGIIKNWIDTITYADPHLVEDDNGKLSYVEEL